MMSASGDLPGSKVALKMGTVPFYVYGKAVTDNFYLGLGLGIHAWSMSGTIDLNMGLQILTLGYEDESGDNSSNAIGVAVGVSYKL